jgi:hypothetical protein
VISHAPPPPQSFASQILEAVETVDNQFGEGYAHAHPELVEQHLPTLSTAAAAERQAHTAAQWEKCLVYTEEEQRDLRHQDFQKAYEDAGIPTARTHKPSKRSGEYQPTDEELHLVEVLRLNIALSRLGTRRESITGIRPAGTDRQFPSQLFWASFLFDNAEGGIAEESIREAFVPEYAIICDWPGKLPNECIAMLMHYFRVVHYRISPECQPQFMPVHRRPDRFIIGIFTPKRWRQALAFSVCPTLQELAEPYDHKKHGWYL